MLKSAPRHLRSILLILAGLVAFASSPLAAASNGAASDPAFEQRVREISREFRCLVCQNQSIEDSNAPLAQDLRQLIGERLRAGDDEKQIRAFLVARYGDWILLKPPFKWATLLLWLGPFLLLALGLGLMRLFYRRRREEERTDPSAQDLSLEERRRLAVLLDQDPP